MIDQGALSLSLCLSLFRCIVHIVIQREYISKLAVDPSRRGKPVAWQPIVLLDQKLAGKKLARASGQPHPSSFPLYSNRPERNGTSSFIFFYSGETEADLWLSRLASSPVHLACLQLCAGCCILRLSIGLLLGDNRYSSPTMTGSTPGGRC